MVLVPAAVQGGRMLWIYSSGYSLLPNHICSRTEDVGRIQDAVVFGEQPQIT